MSIVIHSYRCERLSAKQERLVLHATVRAEPKQIIVDIGRYEKRPFFMIHECGQLCDYQYKAMSGLLNAVFLAYAATQDDMNISETL